MGNEKASKASGSIWHELESILTFVLDDGDGALAAV
jgi:hypothetical protein